MDKFKEHNIFIIKLELRLNYKKVIKKTIS